MNKTQCKYNNRIFKTIYSGDCCIKRENILLDNDAGFFSLHLMGMRIGLIYYFPFILV